VLCDPYGFATVVASLLIAFLNVKKDLCLRGLEWANFFLADESGGIGPYLQDLPHGALSLHASYIGIAMTAIGAAAVIAQTQAGASALIAISCMLMIIAAFMNIDAIAFSQTLVSVAAAVLLPAMAAITQSWSRLQGVFGTARRQWRIQSQVTSRPRC
jgi:hypothetical protein